MVVVGGKDNKHKVQLKNKCVAIIFLYICCFYVILFQLVKCCNPKNKIKIIIIKVKVVKCGGSERVLK